MTQAFNTLTQDAQIARLTALAHRATKAFGMPAAEVVFHSYTNNTLYRVTDGDDNYVLRIHRPNLKRLTWIRSELMWLSAINAQTALIVPEPITDTVYTGELEGIDVPVYCVMFRWIEGESINAEALSTDHIAKIGRFAADLHDFSRRFATPDGFVRPHLDYEGMFGIDSPYYAGEDSEALIKTLSNGVIEAVQAQVKRVMDKLGQASDAYGMIHADLFPKNLLWRNGEIGVVDFDDSAFGYYVYDLAPAMLGFKQSANYDRIRDTLWSAYTQARNLKNMTIQDLETLIAGRYVASIRWVAGNIGHPAIRDRAPQIITERVAQLQDFLNTGTLKLV